MQKRQGELPRTDILVPPHNLIRDRDAAYGSDFDRQLGVVLATATAGISPPC